MRRYLEVLSKAHSVQRINRPRNDARGGMDEVLHVRLDKNGKLHEYHLNRKAKLTYHSPLSNGKALFRYLSDREIEALRLFIWEMR